MWSFSSAGFSGSRRLSGAPASLCRSLAASAVAAGLAVSSGCAAGADEAARAGAGSACVVFRASAFGRGRGAFAARSVAFVRALASSPAPVLVLFPGAPCPAGLVPSSSSSRCFRGLGSGSWASAALAAGLGVPVACFGLSLSSLPAWGSWVPFAGGFLLSPSAPPSPARQLALF